MLRQKHGDPTHLSGDAEAHVQDTSQFSEEDINEAIRQSLVQHAADRNAHLAEKREVDRALAVSVAGLLTSAAEDNSTTSDAEPAVSEETTEIINKGY